ncbi:ABC transporter substrate-binding protein [Paenibacillus allorhizosphaerae]|uniref:Extracellular solute-binding protein n=1 Tax=Paenibacillus allorhizosphaerae TaxID=2849866 RepID=A0ABM8VGA0_9BACL|nr:extracellular solute-binding protein [Paenibacillus allorhizosphaerae]CAG7637901.1 hypothetical protein PAECIP111802_02386 [Paenibacillus allorhizosphaerae]
MKTKRLVVLTGAALLSFVTACQSGGGDKVAEKPKESVDLSKPAELTFFMMAGDSEEGFNERIGNPIRKKFPHYTIKYIRSQQGTTLPELITAGQVIDIYFDSIGNFSDGLLKYQMEYDMTDLMKKSGVDVNRYEPTLIDAMKQISGGKMYGLPVYNSNLVLFYNKAIFDKFGVPYPKDGMTWDETLALAGKLTRTEDGKQYLGLTVSPTHLFRMNQFSLPYVEPGKDTPTVNRDPWKKLLQKTIIEPAADEGYKAKIIELKNKLPYREALLKEQYMAMFVFLSSMPFTVPDEIAPLNWDMVSLPTFSEMPGIGSQAYPTYFSVTAMSKNKEAAMEVIKFLGSDEYQTEMARKGTMPVLNNESIKKLLGQDTQFKDKNFNAVFHNKFAPISPKTIYDVSIEKILTNKLVPLAKQEIDINTALRTAEDEANKSIMELKLK